MSKDQHINPWPLVGVGAIAFAAFANSLGNGFVYDDHFLIERNRLILDADLWGVFTTHYWGGYEDEANANGQYRPLAVLSFVLDGWGGIAPFRFHLTNVLLHVGNSLLAYLLCASMGLQRGAVFAALLFAVHPIHAEAVAGVTFGRADLLAALFSLSALLLYVRRHRRGYGLALASFFCALLSKESALTALGLVAVVDATLALSEARAARVGDLIRQRGPRWAGFVGVFVLYLALRKGAAGLGFSAENVLALNNPLIDQPLDHRLITAAGLFYEYLVLVLFPVQLSVDYSAIPVVASLLSLEVLAGLVMGVAGVVLCAGAFWRPWPRVFFGLAFFLVSYSAVSQTLVLINAIFQERFLYLPVLGLFALAGLGFERVQKRWAFVLAGLILAGYGARTAVRNADWHSDLTLYQSAVAAYPQSAKMQHALGDALAERGRVAEAEAAYQKALAIREDALTYNNLGNFYAATGRFERAVSAYQKAVAMQPDYVAAWMNKGLAAMRGGQVRDAHAAFERAAVLNPDDAEVFYNLGVAREAMNAPGPAASAYARAIALRPGWAEAHFNLGKAHRDRGDKPAAIRTYRRFLQLWRGDPQVAQLARRELESLSR